MPQRVTTALILILLTRLWSASPQFDSVGESSGLQFTLTSGTRAKAYIPESMSGGVGFIDYDKDGWVDVFLVNGSTLEAERQRSNQATDRLFRNNGNGTFTDVTEKAGVGDNAWGMGVCIGDVNNDGFDDIYVTNFGPNRLYVNNGDGTFKEKAKEAGVDDPSWSSSAAFADYDADGDLDLYVSNYVEFDVHKPPADTDLCRYRGMKVQCGPQGLVPAADRLYENRGNGRFRDAGERAGTAKVKASYGLGVIWSDYDSDGDMDLFVANDSMPNFLFQNNGDGTFTEVGLLAGVALSEDGREQASMGVDFGDYDNDGDMDLIVTNFSEDYDTLYRNEGGGRFIDVSYQAGIGEVTWPYLAWGIQFVDLDLDGFLDVVIANGHVYPEVDKYDLGTKYRQRKLLFHNRGDGRFEEQGTAAGKPFQELTAGRGLAVGDVNNDGRMDLLAANLDEGPSLLLNRGASGNWLFLKLVGTASNKSAIGTRVTARTGDRIQTREVRSGGSYQSQSDLRVHFGLGASREVDELSIRWPSGRRQTMKHVAGNQILTIREP